MLQLEALRMAHDEIKKGENTQLFRDLVNRINGSLDKTILGDYPSLFTLCVMSFLTE